MKLNRHITAAATTFMGLLIIASPAQADPHKKRKSNLKWSPSITQTYMPEERNSLPQWAQRKLSASEAKSIAMRRVPGAEVVDISLKGNTYRVRLIRRDGRVVDVFIDAVTGRVR